MQHEPRIFAIGGGGATYGSDPALESALLALVGSPARVGYLGAASKDDPRRIAHVRASFGALGATVEPLSMDQPLGEFVRALDSLAILYVGGGHTPSLVAYLRESGKGHEALLAARRGLVLAGVSAGAVCWFEFGLFDQHGRGLEPLPALGAVAGCLCPHFDSDPDRRAAFPRLIAEGRLPPGHAIDDGAALLFEGGRLAGAFSARAGAGGYVLGSDGSVWPVATR